MENQLMEQSAELFGIEQPLWIEEELTLYDVEAIQRGGCASGAYMPAVTYYQAAQTMAEHGDDVCEYVADSICEAMEFNPYDTTWGGVCCHVLSSAVELWAHSIDVDGVLEDYWEKLSEKLGEKLGEARYCDDWVSLPDESSWFGWIETEASLPKLIHADSFESAYSIYIDLCDTVPQNETFEAYGFDTIEDYNKFLTDWADSDSEGYPEYPNLAEGYQYQDNTTGTGIVFVGYCDSAIRVEDLSELEELVR